MDQSFPHEPYIYSTRNYSPSSAKHATLIDTHRESLDEASVKEIEAKWTAESEERIDAVGRGELQTIDGPSALQDLRSSLRK